MGYLIAGVVVLGLLFVLVLLAAVAFLLAKKAGMLAPAAKEKLPYEKKAYFFTKAERSFYGVLKQAVGDRFDVFGKVRLADVIEVKKGTDQWRTHFNKIQSKHVDFLLCEPEFVAPALVIELDDSSHKKPKTQETDAFVDQALGDAGLPILRVPAKHGYDPAALRADIEQRINSTGQ